MRKNIFLPLIFCSSAILSYSQNIGINTDGSSPETGVMLDVKIPTDKATTAAVTTFFQLKSLNTSGNELKFRFGLKTDATQANRYGFMDFPDFTAGTPTYLNLALQPSGGNVGIGTTAPVWDLDITRGPANGYVLAQVKNTAAGTNAGAGYITWNDASKWAEMTLGSSTATTTTFGYANANFANFLTNTTMALGSTAASPLVMGTSNSERMRIDANGYVGIGTTAPSFDVELSKNANGGVNMVSHNTSTGGSACAFSYVLNDANKWVTLGVNGSGFSSTTFGIAGANQSQVVANTPLVIGTANGNHTYFGTNNTIRGIIDGTTGYFGMGTVTPVEELQVNGHIAIGKDLVNNAAASTYRFYTPVNSLSANVAPIGNTLQVEAGHLTSTSIPITNAATAGSLILKGGNVGDLGQNGTTATTFTAGNVDLYGGYSVTGVVASNTTRVPGSVRFFTATNASNSDVTFTERMRVHYNGNVGIGTSAPATLLHIDLSSSAAHEIRVDKDVDWVGSGFTQLRLCGKTLPTHMLRIGYSTTGDFAVLQSQVSGAGIFNPIALNPNGGNVGVGVTNPSTKFEVYSNSTGGIRTYGPVSGVGGMIQIRDNDDAAATAWPGGCHLAIWPNLNGLGILRFVKSGISQWDFVDRSTVNNAANRRFAIHDANGVGDIITFWGNGSVGIGCSSPAYTLDVRGTLGVSGQITTSAAVVTTGVAACSDIRYKKNIVPLQNSLASVMKLQGVNYLWKQEEFPEKNFTGDVQVGFIAQELEKVFPQMVLTDQAGYKSVDYSRLTPVLVEAIKEQQKQIDELKAELVKMRAEKIAPADGTPIQPVQAN